MLEVESLVWRFKTQTTCLAERAVEKTLSRRFSRARDKEWEVLLNQEAKKEVTSQQKACSAVEE